MNDKNVKWLVILLAVVAAFGTDYLLPRWGRVTLLTVGIFGSLIGFCRSYWSKRFWSLFSVCLVVHMALAVHFRDRINAVSPPALFVIAVVEIILIAVSLDLVFPTRDSRGESR